MKNRPTTKSVQQQQNNDHLKQPKQTTGEMERVHSEEQVTCWTRCGSHTRVCHPVVSATMVKEIEHKPQQTTETSHGRLNQVFERLFLISRQQIQRIH